MAEVINLRRVRKRAERDAASLEAAAARARHGQTSTQREAASKAKDVLRRALDQARLTSSGLDGEPPE
ncbi:MAG TPA: DUF4169 family protein [Acetobacteraceae bacterium]